MALKFKLTKDEHEKLSDALKGEYKDNGDGTFTLDAEGIEDTSGLKAQNARLLEETKAAKEKARLEAAEREKLAEEKARASGDIAALEKSYQERMAKLQADFDGYKTTSDKALHEVLVEKEVQTLATRLGGSEAAGVFIPHLRSRFSVERDENGMPKTRIMDANGKPSASTADELFKEFASNPMFKGVVVKTQAQGLPGAAEKGAPAEPQKSANLFGANALLDRANQLAAQDGGE